MGVQPREEHYSPDHYFTLPVQRRVYKESLPTIGKPEKTESVERDKIFSEKISAN